MKLIISRRYLLILITIALVASTGSLLAQVYKVVDENGKVSFTDIQPADGSKPVELAPISVIETPVYETKPAQDESLPDAVAPSLGDMRRSYRDFEIISPQPEQSIWQPEEATIVAWNVSSQLQPGMTVSIFVNGKQYTSSTERTIPIGRLDRGEHTVTAELRDAKNRRVATAKPVTFYIRQPNIYSNRPRPTPRG